MDHSPQHATDVRAALHDWFSENARDMPWRKTRDPYHVWVSEVMLQQTRVDQATPYFKRFLDAFPDLDRLASAELDEVLVLWEGLGYYSRARNLHAAARQVVAEHDGQVPSDYHAFRSLPGVGPYTAAAVSSIAFDRPHAVLDGNVIRVLTRLYAIGDDVAQRQTRKRLEALADALLDRRNPGVHNEALMELGATVCTPVAPDCEHCPVHGPCAARAQGTPERYPVKARRGAVPHFDVAVGIVFRDTDQVLIQRRPEDGLLGGLWEFPGGKREAGERIEDTCVRELREELGIEVAVDGLLHRLSHAYTHFKITLYAFRCSLTAGTPASKAGQPVRWAPLDTLSEYAFPRANRRLIELLEQRHPTRG